MPASLFDSAYYADQFSTPAMRAVFSDEGRFGSWLAFEAALARAQARVGVIPEAAARAITAAARLDNLDPAAMKAQYERVGFAIVPLVRQLSAACSPEAARHVHWGATTQDVLDTGLVLQMRAGLGLIAAELDAVLRALMRLVRDHRGTVMAGRTLQQHAAPITFGWKAAGWLDEGLRLRARLPGLEARLYRVQFGGAVGTLAPLGAQGGAVRAALAADLGLADPGMTWHTARDGFAEAVFWLGLAGGWLARIGTEVAALMRTEIGELAEPRAPGRGASSAMPQKRNPIACPQIVAIGTRLRWLVGQQMESLVQEHERGLAAMPVEWMVIPEAFLLASGAFHHARPLLEGLEVDADRMRANLGLGGGLIMSEAAMAGLAPHLGRAEAQALVAQAAAEASANGGTLRARLLARAEVRAHLDEAALDALLDPAAYTGTAAGMADAILGRAEAEGL